MGYGSIDLWTYRPIDSQFPEVRPAMYHNPKNDNPLVTIVGMCGSGKSSVADALRRRGWQIIRFGEITMHQLEKRGLPKNEANERVIREELRKTHGTDAYAKLSLPRIKEALAAGPTAVDGLYSWAEYKFLKRNLENQMHVVAVFTTRPIRYERLACRPVRPLSPDEAELRDFAEIENLEKGGPIAMADYVVLNDGTEEELLLSIDRLLSTHIFTNKI
jgi:dephospho-CoA kinase